MKYTYNTCNHIVWSPRREMDFELFTFSTDLICLARSAPSGLTLSVTTYDIFVTHTAQDVFLNLFLCFLHMFWSYAV